MVGSLLYYYNMMATEKEKAQIDKLLADGAELDAYIEEICADAYAGMDRLPEEKARIVQQAAQRRLEAQSAEKSGETRGPPEKYSIGKTTDNKPFVEVEQDILAGVPEADWVKTVKENLKKKFPNGITVGNNEINIDYQSRKEMTFSRYMKWLYNNDPQLRADKLRATDNADEILRATTDWVNEGLDHPRKDKIAYFARGNVLLRVGGNGYTAEVVVGTRESGSMLLYDILNLQPASFTEKETDAAKTENPSPGTNRNTASVSEHSIRRSELKSQEKFSADGNTATPQENDKTALAYFGRTHKWSETGYVLLNGARLDFSGRHEGGSGGYRSVDHRDIIDALGEDYGGDSYTGGMVRFMQEGNIRISPESGGINLAVMPTKAQMDSLSDFISKERGEVILDIDDAGGNTISSTEYPRGTHANKVLQDIRNYFNDGTLPEVSASPSVSQFRYSVSESDAGAEGTTAFTLDSIPKKAQDYLRRVRGQTAAAIQQTLSMPFAARQEVLKPAIEEMMNEYLQTGRISQETVDRSFEESYRRGVEMDTEFYDEYKDVKTRLRDLKVTLSETDRADIADFDDFRRAAFGRLRIADEGGLPVDVAYSQMRELAPELFPAGITHPADQLMQMFEVSKRIERVRRSLDEFHGEEAEEFKRWAKNDYEASVENMLGSLRVARRYAKARMRQKQARCPTLGVGRGDEHDVLRLLRRRRGLRREPPGVLRSPGRGVSHGQGRPRSGGKAVRVL